jgi:hypothetical protein
VVPGSAPVPPESGDRSDVIDPSARTFAGVFRRAQRASDTANFKARPSRACVTNTAQSSANSRRVATQLTGITAWVVPADRHICILFLDTTDECVAGPGGTGQPLANLKDGGGSLTYHKDGETTIIGVTPDGVSGVELTQRGGAKHAFAATDNVWAAQVKGGTKSVRLMDGSGNAERNAYDGSDG